MVDLRVHLNDTEFYGNVLPDNMEEVKYLEASVINDERVYEQSAVGATQAVLVPLAANLSTGIYKEK